MDDNLSFLDDKEPAGEPEVIEQPVEQPEQEAKPERQRGPDGKFAQAEPDKPEPVMVPLQALHETRDEVKSLKAELEQYRQQQAPQPQVEVPNLFEDPEGRLALQDARVQQLIYTERLNNSRNFAVMKHGEDMVNQALEWGQQRCAADPHFNNVVMGQMDPVGFAIEQFNREQIVNNVKPDEFQQFQAWKAAQAQTQQPQSSNPPPPSSIASIPSSGGAGHIPVGPGQAFDSLFK